MNILSFGRVLVHTIGLGRQNVKLGLSLAMPKPSPSMSFVGPIQVELFPRHAKKPEF